MSASADGTRLITRPFVVVTLASFAYFLNVGAWLPVLPRFTDEVLHGGSIAVGIVAGAFSVSAIVARPVAGRIGDQRGRRILIVVGGVIVAASMLATPLTQTLAITSLVAISLLVVLRLVYGVGEAMLFTGAATMISDLAPPERRGEALSLFTLSLYGGLALGAVAGELTLDQFGFTGVWMLCGALGIIGAGLGLLLRETLAADPPAPVSRGLVHPAALGPGTIMAFSVWSFAGFTAFLPLYATRTLGLKGAGTVVFVYSIVIFAVRLFGAKLPDKLGPSRAAATSLVGSCVGLLIVAAFPTLRGLYVGAIVFALGQSLAFPALMSMAIDAAPEPERGSVVGSFTAFVDIGFGLGPIVSGVIAALSSYRGVFVSGALAAAAGLILLQVRDRRAAN